VSEADAEIEAAIRSAWRIAPESVRAHAGGMNSRTWHVTAGDRRWVAKAVPADAAARFASGLAVAAIVDAAGIPAGAPEPTPDGRTWIAIDDHVLALLRFVGGEALVGDEADEQRLMGSTLARAHQALIGSEVRDAGTFHWLDIDAPHLDVEPWVRPAVRQAIEAYDALPATLTLGVLHTDPAPEAFLLDRSTGVCGLIDWDTGLVGPLMYDVASAVMYLGGPEHADAFLAAYLAAGILAPAELERSLAPMLHLRWAVQADYFGRRLATNDLTGIADADANQRGLDDARRAIGVRGQSL
jgi:Ser/Thr protein kinase RdoA (MazF antagonist)